MVNQGSRPLPSRVSQLQVVAVANSTAASARASIDFDGIGAKVKAYGYLEDIANVPNVDLVVMSVRISLHYALMMKPALLGGKGVFVDRPLGASTKEVLEMADLAKEEEVKTSYACQRELAASLLLSSISWHLAR